jgi:hypothetical protein
VTEPELLAAIGRLQQARQAAPRPRAVPGQPGSAWADALDEWEATGERGPRVRTVLGPGVFDGERERIYRLLRRAEAAGLLTLSGRHGDVERAKLTAAGLQATPSTEGGLEP